MKLEVRNGRRGLFRWLSATLVVGMVLGTDFLARKIVQLNRETTVGSGRTRHPDFHHGFHPDYEWQDRFGPIRVRMVSNSLGMRDGERRVVPPVGDRPRILLIGDSFTEGVGVPWEETFAGRLQAALAPKGVEVLNAGVVSYTPILERIKVRHLYEEQGLRFNRVVLFLDLSDVKDDMFYEEDATGRARPIPYGPFASQAGWGRWVEKFSDVCETRIEPNFILLGALARNIKIPLRQLSRKELGPQGAFAALPEFVRDYELGDIPQREITERGLRRCAENLSSLAEYLRERGIPLTLVIYRWPQYRMPAAGEARYPKYWRSWAEQNGVDFIDLFRLFEGREPIRQWHLEGDDHWNAAGHAVVAEALLAQWDRIRPMAAGEVTPGPGIDRRQRPE